MKGVDETKKGFVNYFWVFIVSFGLIDIAWFKACMHTKRGKRPTSFTVTMIWLPGSGDPDGKLHLGLCWMHRLLAMSFWWLGIFRNILAFYDFTCLYGSAFSDPSLQLTFRKNENVLNKSYLHPAASGRFAGWTCRVKIHTFGVACCCCVEVSAAKTYPEKNEQI